MSTFLEEIKDIWIKWEEVKLNSTIIPKIIYYKTSSVVDKGTFYRLLDEIDGFIIIHSEDIEKIRFLFSQLRIKMEPLENRDMFQWCKLYKMTTNFQRNGLAKFEYYQTDRYFEFWETIKNTFENRSKVL